MAIVEKTCYVAKCDDCGEAIGGGDSDELHFPSEEDALGVAHNYGWQERDGKLLCEDCFWAVEDLQKAK